MILNCLFTISTIFLEHTISWNLIQYKPAVSLQQSGREGNKLKELHHFILGLFCLQNCGMMLLKPNKSQITSLFARGNKC